MEKEYFLIANDEKGRPYTWGFYFKSLEKATAALLPNTWVVDQDGKKYAERGI